MKRARVDLKPASALRLMVLVVGSAFLSGHLADEMRYHRRDGCWLVWLGTGSVRACVPLPRRDQCSIAFWDPVGASAELHTLSSSSPLIPVSIPFYHHHHHHCFVLLFPFFFCSCAVLYLLLLPSFPHHGGTIVQYYRIHETLALRSMGLFVADDGHYQGWLAALLCCWAALSEDEHPIEKQKISRRKSLCHL